MKRKYLVLIVLFISLSSICWIFSGCDRENNPPNRIGVVIPLTGPAGSLGLNAKKAIELISANSTLNVEFIDSKGIPKDAMNGVKKLLLSKPNYIISYMSSVSKAILPEIEKNNIVSFHFSSSSDILENTNNAFRFYISSKLQMQYVYDYLMKSEDNNPKIAFVYLNDEYGIGALQAFKSFYKDNLYELPYSNNINDIKNNLILLKQYSPNFVVTVGYSSILGNIIKKIREIGISVPIVSDDAISYPDVLESAGKAAEGIVFVGLPFEQSDTSLFYKEYYHKTGEKPSDFAFLSYELTKILSESPMNVNNSKKYFLDNKFSTSFGEISFDKNRNLMLPLTYRIIVNGKPTAFSNAHK